MLQKRLDRVSLSPSRYLASLLALLLAPGLCIAQNNRLPLSIAKRLAAPAWQVRSQGLGELLILPGGLRSPKVQRAMFLLTRKENQEIAKGNVDGEDLDYERYSDRLIDGLQEIAKMHNLAAYRALAEGPYNGDSRLGFWMSSRKEGLPVYLDVARNNVVYTARAEAIKVLSEMVQRGDERQPKHEFPEEVFPLLHLSSHERAEAKNVIVKALNDKSEDVRFWAIDAIADIGDLQDIEALKAAQANDPQKDLLPLFNRALAKMEDKAAK